MPDFQDLLIEKFVKIRQAYQYPNVSLPALKGFANEVGITAEEWEQVINLFHDHIEKGNSYLKHKNWSDAIEEFEIAYKLDPAQSEVLFGLAKAYSGRWWEKKRSNDKKKGIEYAEQGLNIDPSHDKLAGIITDLKNAPFEPWISPKTTWKLVRYAVWLAILGFGVGYYYQNQELIHRVVNKWLNPTPKTVANQKDVIVLENVIFPAGSVTLPESAKPDLDKLADYLQKNPQIKGEIAGHTDNVGLSSLNLQLSEARAKLVYQYLLNKGIAANRLFFKGYGDTHPAFPNTTEINKAKNRRIEFKPL
jgi:outer membrane protein OmpA-like peptidoglycan-associated protein